MSSNTVGNSNRVSERRTKIQEGRVNERWNEREIALNNELDTEISITNTQNLTFEKMLTFRCVWH